MKHFWLFYFIVGLSIVPTLAQEVLIDTAYYADSSLAPAKLNPGSRLTRPEKRVIITRKLLMQFSEVNAWYARAEGGFRSSVALLSNSLDGLVSTATPPKPTWSVLLGYTHQNTWSVETGYAHAPILHTIRIANNGDPLEYTYTNSSPGIPVRVKRRLGLGRQATNGAGFWLTAGAWVVPNGSGPTGSFSLIGYSTYGRYRVDTLRLNNLTIVPNQVTVMGELGIDAAIRVSACLFLDGSLRRYWGLGNALQSTLTYTVNNRSPKQATITSDGSGWGFGLSLRYIDARQYGLKKR